MRKVGIIFAMKEELDTFLKLVKLEETKEVKGIAINKCSNEDTTMYLIESGIGKVNSARATQLLIDEEEVDYIFNIGVAGGIDERLNIGDIVIGEKLYQYDFDISAFGHKRCYIPKVGEYVESDKELINIITNNKEDIDANILVGNIASADKFLTDKEEGKNLNKDLDALCVEMEGASIAQVSYLNNVPFVVVRSISDTPNGNNNIDFDEFLEDSAKKVSEFMLKVITKL